MLFNVAPGHFNNKDSASTTCLKKSGAALGTVMLTNCHEEGTSYGEELDCWLFNLAPDLVTYLVASNGTPSPGPTTTIAVFSELKFGDPPLKLALADELYVGTAALMAKIRRNIVHRDEHRTVLHSCIGRRFANV